MEGGVYKAEFVYIRDSEETPPADSPRETTHALKVSFHWKKKRLFDKIEKLQGAMVTSGVMGGWRRRRREWGEGESLALEPPPSPNLG